MRLNRFIASGMGISRRQADILIKSGQVTVNVQKATLGTTINEYEQVRVSGQIIKPKHDLTCLLLNKPIGYVCSHRGQGNPTIYELLPLEHQKLKLAGRLDKDSSGLMILSDDGQLIYDLTHPSSRKVKIYEVELDRPLANVDLQSITHGGVTLKDGLSRFNIEPLNSNHLKITMYEGRNRQIRRTFEALGYKVEKLHRTKIGLYNLNGLEPGKYRLIDKK